MLALNKLIVVPDGRALFAYMQAILEVTGLMAGERFDIALFMENYGTHLQEGRLQKHSDGTYSLTEKGRRYFISRLTVKPETPGQQISRSEVVGMIRQITAEIPGVEWERI
jgi:hypothetical protein